MSNEPEFYLIAEWDNGRITTSTVTNLDEYEYAFVMGTVSEEGSFTINADDSADLSQKIDLLIALVSHFNPATHHPVILNMDNHSLPAGTLIEDICASILRVVPRHEDVITETFDALSDEQYKHSVTGNGTQYVMKDGLPVLQNKIAGVLDDASMATLYLQAMVHVAMDEDFQGSHKSAQDVVHGTLLDLLHSFRSDMAHHIDGSSFGFLRLLH